MRYVVLLPSANSGTMTTENRYSDRLDEFGAEAYLTGYVNANSTAPTNIDISPCDVKKNQTLTLKNEIRHNDDSRK